MLCPIGVRGPTLAPTASIQPRRGPDRVRSSGV